ncbi:MAG: molybdopterin-dependent oxidoreductase [Alteromonadaceae bacterium]|nr:molybdopterin-dependent oxidoreductase [Alteromonadaceae bacterium]
MSETTQTLFRACHLCEAICGLEIKTQGSEIVSIKGDNADPFSGGHLCPKAMALKDLQEDPDRLRKPVKRVGDNWQEITWQEALDEVARSLTDVQRQYGNDSVAVFAGNPNVHNYGNLTHGRLLRKALQTKSNYSATSLDQLPHHLIAYHLYGHQFLLPIPDIDHTDYMVIIGANPLVSNGSLMTAPNITRKLQQIQKRNGKFVVIDPRRTETAKAADEHHFIKPGSDVYLLLAIANYVFKSNKVNTAHLGDLLVGLGEVELAVADFSAELAASKTGVSAEIIEDIAENLINTKRAVLYGRMGISVQQYGTLCQWLINIINLVTGHTDVEGGAMFTSPAVAYVKKGAPGAGHFGKFRSRVSGLPEFGGELPSVALAEEMMTEGEGQIKAMVTIAGNPVLSSANGKQIDEAMENLDYVVAIDFYINETTRHANIILPPSSPLEHEHYDFAFLRLAVRDTTRINPAIFDKDNDALHDWQIYNKLSEKIAELKNNDFSPLPDPKHIVDWELKNGLYGQNHELNLSWEMLEANPHGIDLGPLKTSLKDRIATLSGNIELIIPECMQDLESLDKTIDTQDGKLLLIGRRHIRSNNSWMHNYQRLVKGKPHWQLFMHPDDLAARGIENGAEVTIKSRVGEVSTVVKATDEMMPGVISLPHGWGHQKAGVKAQVASQTQGVSCNDLTDETFYDAISGNAALNGVPVEVFNKAG